MVDLNNIAGKWQKRWEKKGIFKTKESNGKKKFYVLEMFPYPSGSGLHMGHLRNYAMGDSFARYKRMKGFNVLYPMGYDSFGLPAENAAIKQKVDPRTWTEKNIKKMEKQQKSIGLSYDWSREIMTHSKEYYKWTQWIFLKLFEKGLAYRKEAPVNWCPGCKTVLANEQVTNGKCWRCKSEAEEKQLEQWFFRIKDYARELLDGLEKLKEWPEKVKTMQENWIGRSEGTEIYFRVKDSGEVIPIFTTRADTLFGVTFMVFAPEHPLVKGWVEGTKYEKSFLKFLKEVQQENKFKRTAEDVEKKGMFIGKYAINPATGDEIPVYVGNFVVYEYGAGAVMAVPAHDQRDFEFAKKFKIPIKVVIQPYAYKLNAEKMPLAYVEDGTLVNSEEFNGLGSKDAIKKISKFLEKKKLGGEVVNYKLRDWLISRQNCLL
jgi:leucyl-tRNA synthetase